MNRELSPDELRILSDREPENFLRACRADRTWDETLGEQGAVAHGYYDAVGLAMDTAALVALKIIAESLNRLSKGADPRG